MPDNRPREDGPCGFFDVDSATSTAMFFPDRFADPGKAAHVDAQVAAVRDALRAGISDTCVSVGEAEAVAKRAVGAGHHWPTTSMTDERADCARVDMVAGGSIQITVYGPTAATG